MKLSHESVNSLFHSCGGVLSEYWLIVFIVIQYFAVKIFEITVNSMAAVDSVITVHEVIVIRSTNLCNNHCNLAVTGGMHNCA